MQPTVRVSGAIAEPCGARGRVAHKMRSRVNCVKRGGRVSTAARLLEAEVYSISDWLEQIRLSPQALKGRDGILYWRELGWLNC